MLVWGGVDMGWGVITTPRGIDSLGLVWDGGWWVGGWVVVVARSAVGARLWGVWGGRVAGGMGVVGVVFGRVDTGWGSHYDP